MQYAETFAVPVHKSLQLRQFLPFPDTMLGKKVSVRDDAMLGGELQKHMLDTWNSYWVGSGAK